MPDGLALLLHAQVARPSPELQGEWPGPSSLTVVAASA
jgi:hypothetical protein